MAEIQWHEVSAETDYISWVFFHNPPMHIHGLLIKKNISTTIKTYNSLLLSNIVNMTNYDTDEKSCSKDLYTIHEATIVQKTRFFTKCISSILTIIKMLKCSKKDKKQNVDHRK